MPRVKYVYTEDRNGRPYTYFRRRVGTPKIAMKHQPGQDGFAEEYQQLVTSMNLGHKPEKLSRDWFTNQMTRYPGRDAHPKVRAAFALYRRFQRLLDGRRFDGDTFAHGLLGELIVEYHFAGMKKAPAGTPGYDFTDAQGRRVQVKSWRGEAKGTPRTIYIRGHDKPDRVICVRILDDGYELPIDLLPQGPGGITISEDGEVYRGDSSDPPKAPEELMDMQPVQKRRGQLAPETMP